MSDVGLLLYGDETIEYKVQRLASRQTLGIEVHPNGRVLVRAPQDCPQSVIEARVRRRAAWISRQIADFERYKPRTPERQYVSGESHMYLGRQYRLRVLSAPESGVLLARGELLVRLKGVPTPPRVKAALDSWYRDRAKVIFNEVLNASLRRVHSLECPGLIVRRMQSRWGSLSPAGRMTLNVSLVRAPRTCIEYVVVHELCHVKHRSHDSRFFRAMGQVMPDWEKRKERLENALL